MGFRDSANFNDIATDFDRLFEDIDRLSDLEGEALEAVFQDHGVHTVLDVACGTGIQSIGLVRRGYLVFASDISSQMVQITQMKAIAENLTMTVRRADFRTLTPWRGECFDAVVSSGNSLTLMKTYKDIDRSLQSMLACLKIPGGIGIVGIHNYAPLQRQGQVLLLRKTQVSKSTAELIIDVRQFDENRTRVSYLFLNYQERRWRMKSYTKSYMVLTPEALTQHMIKAGFREVSLLDVSGRRSYTQNDEWIMAVGLS